MRSLPRGRIPAVAAHHGQIVDIYDASGRGVDRERSYAGLVCAVYFQKIGAGGIYNEVFGNNRKAGIESDGTRNGYLYNIGPGRGVRLGDAVTQIAGPARAASTGAGVGDGVNGAGRGQDVDSHQKKCRKHQESYLLDRFQYVH